MPYRDLLKSWLLIVLCGMLLAGCGFGKNLVTREEQQTYVDARLEFILRYPASWAPFLSTTGSGHYAHYAVTWNVEAAGLNNDTSLIVVSMPHHLLVPGLEPEDILLDLYQDLSVDRRAEELLPAGTSVKLTGHTPHRIIGAWVLEDGSRTYLLSVAAPPQHYKQQENLFNRIAHSFRPYRQAK